MSKISKIIGSNIKALRQSKELTQSDLAGDEITRNMISLIESGNANPSLKTLEHLSEKLEVPMSFFFIDDESQSSDQIKNEIIDKIKQLYSDKSYEKCIELCHSMPIMDEEITFIVAQCEIQLGVESIKMYHLASAKDHFSLATLASEYTIYNSVSISQTVSFYNRLIETVQDETIPPQLTQLNQYSRADTYIYSKNRWSFCGFNVFWSLDAYSFKRIHRRVVVRFQYLPGLE